MNKLRDKVTNKLTEQGLNLAKKGILVQVVIALFLSLFLGVLLSGHAAISALAGAMASILPTCIFTLFAFRYGGATQSNLVAKSFSQGSKVKLALTTILFVIAFAGLNALPIVVFISYAVTTASHSLAMLCFDKQ